MIMSDDVYIIPIIKKSFKWLLKDPTYILLYLIPYAISTIQIIHMRTSFGTTFFRDASIGQNLQLINSLIPLGIWVLFYTLILFIVGMMIFALIIQKVKVQVEGEKIKLAKAFKQALPKIPALLGSYLLLILLLTGPAIALLGLIIFSLSSGFTMTFWLVIGILGLLIWLVPMIYWGVRLSLYAPACVLEDLGPIETLKESWRVTANNFWLTFSLFFLFAILGWIVLFPINFLQITSGWVGSLIAPLLVMIVIGPASSIAITLYYMSLSEGKNFY